MPDAARNLDGDVRLRVADLDNNGAIDLYLTSTRAADTGAGGALVWLGDDNGKFFVLDRRLGSGVRRRLGAEQARERRARSSEACQQAMAPCEAQRHGYDLGYRHRHLHAALTSQRVEASGVQRTAASLGFVPVGRHAVFRGRLLDQHEIVLERVARPEVPVLELLHVLGEAAVALEEPAMEEHRLNGQEVVVPEHEPVEGLAMAREAAHFLVEAAFAIDGAGRRLPREPVGAGAARLQRRREQRLDVVGEEHVVVVEEVEPFARGHREREVAGACASQALAGGVIAQAQPVGELVDDRARGARPVLDDDDFDVVVRLRRARCERFA